MMYNPVLKYLARMVVFGLLVLIKPVPAQVSPTWYVDKTQGKSSYGLIHLCARPSLGENQTISGWLPGHVYIGLFPAEGNNYIAVGAYPSANIDKLDNLLNAAYSQGRLYSEFASIKGEHCVVVNATEEQFEHASEIIVNTDNNEPYILGFEDCVALGKRVAESLGLIVETGVLTRPKSFILELVQSNELK